MAEYFPRANLIQGGVMPVTPQTVTVPLVDPALKVQAAGFGTLSQRLDQFSAVAFKEAGIKAQAAGAAYGASNAPTLEQVELAKSLGKPVDLPGDPSSISIFERAAYEGSLAVTETNFTAAGRRALTTAMAEAAADPNMDPATFTSKMDIIVSEYADVMRTISPSSAAKIQATLGIVANGQMVSFSRTYVANAKKKLKDDAYVTYDGIVGGLEKIIDGHIPGYDEKGPAGGNGVTIEDKINAEREQAESALVHGGERQKTINGKMASFDKAVAKAKISVIQGWAQTGDYIDNPLQAYLDLTGKKAERRIQSIYKSLLSSDRIKVRKGIFDLYTKQQTIKGDTEAADLKTYKDKTKELMTELNDKRIAGDRVGFIEKRGELNKHDPAAAATFFDDKDFGQTPFDDLEWVKKLEIDIDDFEYDRRQEAEGSLENDRLIVRLNKGRKDGLITSKTYEDLRTKIIDRNKEDLNAALREAQIAFNYEPRNILSVDPTGPQMEARQNYKRAEQRIREAFRRDPEQDLLKAMDVIIKGLVKPEKTISDLVGKLPASLNTPEKVDAAVAALKGGDKSLVALLLQHRPTIAQLKKLGWK
jgi:hypothetical protein